MNVFLWILQVVLAFFYVSGGGYKIFAFDDVAKQIRARWLPRAGWSVLGALEVVGGILLVVPAAVDWMPGLTPLAAAILAVESLALAGIFARYSRRLVAANPMAWTLVMGLAAAFVAYGRYVLAPLT